MLVAQHGGSHARWWETDTLPYCAFWQCPGFGWFSDGFRVAVPGSDNQVLKGSSWFLIPISTYFGLVAYDVAHGASVGMCWRGTQDNNKGFRVVYGHSSQGA